MKKIWVFGFSLLLICLLAIDFVYAKDFGVLGEVYPIKETDFLEFIKTKLKNMEQNGELKKMQEQMTATVKGHIDRPTPVAGITRTIKNRHWQFDPTFTVTRDFTDNHGRVFAHAGEKYNPLKIAPWRNVWLFYDADDKEQVNWVMQEDKKLQGKDKLILVNGSVFTQMQLFKKRIYFDQYGKITAKLGITHVPAEVRQKEEVLKISEILP